MARRVKSSKGKAEGMRPLAPKSAKDDGAKVRDLEKRLAESLERETEALEQQAATSETLKVIARSPTDTQPVFDAIVVSAARLCGVDDAWIRERKRHKQPLSVGHGERDALGFIVGPTYRSSRWNREATWRGKAQDERQRQRGVRGQRHHANAIEPCPKATDHAPAIVAGHQRASVEERP